MRKTFERFESEVSRGEVKGEVTLEVFGATPTEKEDHFEEMYQLVQSEFGDPLPPKKSVTRREEWSFRSNELNRLFDFMVENSPWPKQVLGPVELVFNYEFMWLNPETGKLFPGQTSGHNTEDGSLKSSILFMVRRNSFASLLTTFPYALSDPRISEFLSVVVPYLPFKLSPKHFRHAVPLKTRAGYNHRKLAKEEKEHLTCLLKTT